MTFDRLDASALLFVRVRGERRRRFGRIVADGGLAVFTLGRLFLGVLRAGMIEGIRTGVDFVASSVRR